MAHDETDRTDRRKFLQAGALRDGLGREFDARPGRRKSWSPRRRAPQAEARQDRHRDLDARGGRGPER